MCDSEYIGDTKISLRTHFMEHCWPCTTTSGVFQHLYMDCPGHISSLESMKILDTEPHNFERGVKEAIHIWVYEPTLSHDGGVPQFTDISCISHVYANKSKQSM